MEPIRSHRLNAQTDDTTQARAPSASNARAREVPVDSLHSTNIDYAALATHGRAVVAAAVTMTRSEAIAESLDRTRDAYAGPYKIAGESVPARPQFRMKGGFGDKTVFGPKGPNQSSPEAFRASLNAHGRELVAICARAGVDAGPVMLGYGKPEALVKVTQALIDAGKLPSLPAPATLADCVHKMQWDWAIGTDCVDYCMHALSNATGRSLGALGLTPGADPFGADGSKVPAAFRKVDVASVNPGDIVVLNDLGGDVGHRVIVYDRTACSSASDAAAADVVARWGDVATSFFEGAGPFQVMHVDSSWGADEDGKSFGGYRRDTWVLDTASKKWMSLDPRTSGVFVSEQGPAGEQLAQAVRLRSEP